MNSELQVVKRIRLGKPVPGPKILERRTKGLSTIRQHFLVRMARVTGMRPDSSLIIRWRGLGELANSRTVANASFELVLHSGPKAVSGKFPDLWIVCYPDDPEIVKLVEAEMDSMCEKVADRPAT